MPNKKEWVWKELGVYAETHTEYTKQPAVEKTWGWNPHIRHFEVMRNMKTIDVVQKEMLLHYILLQNRPNSYKIPQGG